MFLSDNGGAPEQKESKHMTDFEARENCLDILTDTQYIKYDIEETFGLIGDCLLPLADSMPRKTAKMFTAYVAAVSHMLGEIEEQLKAVEQKAVAVILGGSELVAFSTKLPAFPDDPAEEPQPEPRAPEMP